MRTLRAWLTFVDPTFVYSAHDKSRTESIIKRLKNTGQLYRGVLNRRMRLSTVTMLKIINHSAYQAWRYGAVNWDLSLQDIYFAIMTTFTAGRVGDFVLSPGYTGDQYLKWESITIQLKEGCDTLDGASMRVELEYTKGRK